MAIKREKYKIVGISGSPRDKNTNYMLKTVLEATGCDYDFILLKDRKIKPCGACGGCFYSHKCIIKDDMRELYEKLPKADIIVLGSPAHFANVTVLMKTFIDRCLPLYFAEKLKGKKVGLVSIGNFKKGEVKYLDNYDIEEKMKDPAARKELETTIRRCINIMKFFCVYHMGMKVVGSVIAINSDPELKKKELIRLGEKLINI